MPLPPPNGGPPPGAPPMPPPMPPVGAAGTIGPQEPFPSTGRPIETVNLIDAMDEEWLKKTAQKVVGDYKRDCGARTEHMKRRANQIKLFCGTLRPKSWPFENCANAHLPILAEAILRLEARILDQMIPAKGDIFHVKPTGMDDEDRAKRVEKHLNWQTKYEMRDWRIGFDATLMQVLIEGSAFRHIYRDVANNRNVATNIPIEDFVVPYTTKSVDPYMADVPRKTRVLRLSRHELEEREDAGVYFKIERLYEGEKDKDGEPTGPPVVEMPDTQMRETVDKAEGTDKPFGNDPDEKRVVLEQHRWLKVPKATDGTDFTDRERPICITVDMATEKVLNLYIREDEDPLDRMRFDNETMLYQQNEQAQQQQYAQQIEMLAMDPMATEEHALAVPKPEPQPQPKPVRMRPIEYFVHYGCIPNPEGFYYLGVGYLLESENEVANTVMSQIIDAATLANVATGFINRQAKMKRGNQEIVPGQLVEVEPVGSLDDMVKIIQFPGPQPAMFEVVKEMKESALGVSQANEVLSGETERNETATTTRIKASMALTNIAVIVRRLQMPLDYEIKALARLNSVFLDSEKPFLFVVPQPGGQLEQIQVTRQDYVEDLDILFTADPKMASQPQRVEEAQGALEMILQNPVLQMLPSYPNLVWTAQRKVFLAMDADDLVMAMGPPPPPPMPPMMMPPGGAPGAPAPSGGPGAPPGDMYPTTDEMKSGELAPPGRGPSPQPGAPPSA